MRYTSTRDKNVSVESAQAIAAGISSDGGLFVPVEIPKLTLDEITAMAELGYIGRAQRILSLYLTDFTADELSQCVSGAYGDGKFSSDEIAPLHELCEGEEILELWRGPTCAFKDMALQLLPRLMTVAVGKTAGKRETVILVATSGDTGKAALEGFRDVEGTRILVFYPVDGVSPMQKLQMTTQEGGNVAVCAIEGNFDDAQTGVKTIFTDRAVGEKLRENGMAFSSANSINWGRLVPQIVYYFSAYCDMLKKGRIKAGDKINIVVPTGNFGNILAAYYACEMGLPVNKLICASNKNRVLTDFFETGVYDINRDFYTTSSPSMDILISSNLERLLFIAGGCSDDSVRSAMADLKRDGKYEIPAPVMQKINAMFASGCCDDEGTKRTIKETFEKYGYLCDTHTAVAVNVYEQYREKSGDSTPTVIASTANPFKFSASVLEAVRPGAAQNLDEFSMVEELARLTGACCPAQLANLRGKPVRFTGVCNRDSMEKAVFNLLGI